MEYSFGQAFFTLLSLIPATFVLSTWIIARFIWLPWRKKLAALPPIKPLYEMKYILSDNEDDQLTDYTLLKDKYLEEETPDGKVFFRYNESFLGFEYWCDKCVKYLFLETVARKYVKTYHCTSLYVDRKEVLQQKRKEQKEQLEKELEEKEEKDSVFANLKNYKKMKKIVAPDKANKFIYRGKFKEAPPFIEPKIFKESITTMDYKSWLSKTNQDSP